MPVDDYDIVDDDDIRSELEDQAERMGNISAAIAWSTPDDEMIDELGEDVFVIADFGGEVAVNGDYIYPGKKIPETPGTHEFTSEFGGRVPVVEDYAYLEHVVPATARKLKVSEERVNEVVKEEKYGEEIPVSVSGDVQIYARPEE